MKVTAPNRKVYLSSTAGVAVSLKPGETRQIPAMFHEAALNAGCKVDVSSVVPSQVPEPDPRDRIETIKQAVQIIADKGNKADFTMSGKPRLSSVRMATNLDVTIAELNAVMDSI